MGIPAQQEHLHLLAIAVTISFGTVKSNGFTSKPFSDD
jgi:hypothetical protein